MSDLELAERLLRQWTEGGGSADGEDRTPIDSPAGGTLGADVVGLFDELIKADFNLFQAIANWAHDT